MPLSLEKLVTSVCKKWNESIVMVMSMAMIVLYSHPAPSVMADLEWG